MIRIRKKSINSKKVKVLLSNLFGVFKCYICDLMHDMTDLVLVSYLNTIPFLQGLESEQGLKSFKLHKKIPS